MSALATIPATGRGVLVAVIDSGWNPGRRDLRVRPGIGLVDRDDPFCLRYSSDDYDRLGHGTACTQLILETAPDAEILPIRVFEQRLETSVELLAAALHSAIEHQASVINLSLATARQDVVVPLYAACEEALAAGAIIVAAAFRPTDSGYPAVFANAIGVEAGPVANVTEFWYRSDAAIECIAAGRSNSFAAARISGIVALARELQPKAGLDAVRAWLAQQATRSS